MRQFTMMLVGVFAWFMLLTPYWFADPNSPWTISIPAALADDDDDDDDSDDEAAVANALNALEAKADALEVKLDIMEAKLDTVLAIIDPDVCDENGGVTVGGFCWVLGAFGQSCTTACTTAGFSSASLAGTRDFAGSAGTDANCLAVLDALGAGPWTQYS